MATNGDGKQNEAGRHQEVGHKSLLQSDALYQVHHHSLTHIHTHTYMYTCLYTCMYTVMFLIYCWGLDFVVYSGD